MTTESTTSPPPIHSKGRALFWAGIGLCLLGIALYVVDYSLKRLITPWYSPVLATCGVLLLVGSVARRRTVARIVALGLVGLLAVFQWYFLVSLSKLPAYAGPAQAGSKLPAFRTTLADGRPFTEQDLERGKTNVLVFFRGRW